MLTWNLLHMKCTSVAILLRNSLSLGKYYCWNAMWVHSLELEDAFKFSKEALGIHNSTWSTFGGENMGGFVLQQLKALIGWSFHQQFIVFHYVPFMRLLCCPSALLNISYLQHGILERGRGGPAISLFPENESKVKSKWENNCHHNDKQTAGCINIFPPEAPVWGNKMHVSPQNNYAVMRLS